MLAQQAMGTHDLAAMRPCELVTSTEPCAMCMGAIPWSGIRQVVCGARDEDARKIGFDEGIKPPGWAAAFESRNIRVIRDVLRLQAAEVLNEYAATGGKIY
jgi:tRNA(Arg) A34 adenosine deaminase TadA